MVLRQGSLRCCGSLAEMYDQERMLKFPRNEIMTNADAVECLLDFSKGPDAMLVATVKMPTFVAPKEGASKCADLNLDE